MLEKIKQHPGEQGNGDWKGLSGQQIPHPSIMKTRITPALRVTGVAGRRLLGVLGLLCRGAVAGCTAVAPEKHPSTEQSALSGASRDLILWPKSEPGLPYAFCGLPKHWCVCNAATRLVLKLIFSVLLKDFESICTTDCHNILQS